MFVVLVVFYSFLFFFIFVIIDITIIFFISLSLSTPNSFVHFDFFFFVSEIIIIIIILNVLRTEFVIETPQEEQRTFEFPSWFVFFGGGLWRHLWRVHFWRFCYLHSLFQLMIIIISILLLRSSYLPLVLLRTLSEFSVFVTLEVFRFTTGF